MASNLLAMASNLLAWTFAANLNQLFRQKANGIWQNVVHPQPKGLAK